MHFLTLTAFPINPVKTLGFPCKHGCMCEQTHILQALLKDAQKHRANPFSILQRRPQANSFGSEARDRQWKELIVKMKEVGQKKKRGVMKRMVKIQFISAALSGTPRQSAALKTHTHTHTWVVNTCGSQTSSHQRSYIFNFRCFLQKV